MNIKFAGKKMELTEGIKGYCEEKLSKLDKFFGQDADCKVTLSAVRGRHTAEATVNYSGFIYRAEETTSDMYVSIDKIVSDFERQIRKNKTRLEKRLRKDSIIDMTITPELFEEEKEFNIVKKKAFTTKPMSDEEAILQMNMLGHNFFVYKSSEDSVNCVVYKRKDGNYGVIEVK